MTNDTVPSLPVVNIVNDVMQIESYLRVATTIKLPSVITTNSSNGVLVTNFLKWQSNLWAGFWESLMSANVTPQASEIAQLFQLGVTLEETMNNVFFGSGLPGVPTAVGICDQLANIVMNGQPILQQLQGIAKTIQDGDREQVAKLVELVAKLQAQFDEQESKLTKGAIGLGKDLVAVVIDVAIAAGTEGDMIQPLLKGIGKIGKDTVGELKLTQDINKTLDELESAWLELDEATADLAAITLTCNQIKAVTDDASAVMNAIQQLTDDWSTVANTTTVSATDWENGYSTALQGWANQMTLVSFTYTTQTITDASPGRVRSVAAA